MPLRKIISRIQKLAILQYIKVKNHTSSMVFAKAAVEGYYTYVKKTGLEKTTQFQKLSQASSHCVDN